MSTTAWRWVSASWIVAAFLIGAFAPWGSLPWNQPPPGADPAECAYLHSTGQDDYAIQMGCWK
jgi:hypothetical protein